MDILLIHGLFGSLSNAPIINAFDKHATVLAPDLLGYGENQSHNTHDLTLSDHVDHLVSTINANSSAPVHVIGHSVGGAVGLLLASDHPELVASYTSVEGNMTLNDAFWSAEIAKTPIDAVNNIIDSYKADVAGWIRGAGVEPTPEQLDIAAQWLDNQPGTTIKAQANAVVTETGRVDYLERFDTLTRNKIPVHLLAGETSFSGWDVPKNIVDKSSSMTKAPGCGHLLMLENPTLFAQLVTRVLS